MTYKIISISVFNCNISVVFISYFCYCSSILFYTLMYCKYNLHEHDDIGGLIIMNDSDLRNITRCMLDITRCLDTIREGQFLKYGLTRGQHSFLTRISENPGINQENLSFLLKVDRSTTAKALKKLIEKGYVKKVHPENNKRDWILFITEEGAALNQSMESAVNSPMQQLYQGLSDREITRLYKSLQLMDTNIVSAYLDYKNTSSGEMDF